MPPVINPTTSVLAFEQWAPFTYQPSASDLIEAVSPLIATQANLTTRKPLALVATTTALSSSTYFNGTDDNGVGATLTASANGALTVASTSLTAGDVVLVKNESTTLRNGLYVVTDAGSAGLPWVLTRHAKMDEPEDFVGYVEVLSGTGTARTIWLCPAQPITVGVTGVTFTQWVNRWRVSVLPPGVTFHPTVGAIVGPATEPWIGNVSLAASADSGATFGAMLTFPMAIAPRAFANRTGVDLVVDAMTALVTPKTAAGGGAADAVVMTAKSGDRQLIYIRFERDGTPLDLGDLEALEFGLKERDPDKLLVLGGGDEIGTHFKKLGSGIGTVYVVPVSFEPKKLKRALVRHQSPDGTYFLGLGEIRYSQENPVWEDGDKLVRRTQTFKVRLDRNLIPTS